MLIEGHLSLTLHYNYRAFSTDCPSYTLWLHVWNSVFFVAVSNGRCTIFLPLFQWNVNVGSQEAQRHQFATTTTGEDIRLPPQMLSTFKPVAMSYYEAIIYGIIGDCSLVTASELSYTKAIPLLPRKMVPTTPAFIAQIHFQCSFPVWFTYRQVLTILRL